MNGFLEGIIPRDIITLLCDYRSGTARDFGPLQRHGTITDTAGSNLVRFSRQGAHFAGTGRITFPDHASGRNTTGALVLLCRPSTPAVDYGRLFSARDAGGTRIELFLRSSMVAGLNNGALDNATSATIRGSDCVAVNYTHAAVPTFYVNGSPVAEGAIPLNITADDAAIVVGNLYTGTVCGNTPIAAVLEVNRNLTDSEMTAVYQRLASLKWCSKASDKATLNDGRKVWASGWGVPVSTATRGGVANAELENTGWRFGSTAFRGTVTADQQIDGKIHKAVVCSTAGPLYLPTNLFNQTPAQAAYGAFEATLYHSGASVTDWHFITNATGITGQRYLLRVTAAEVLELHKDGAAIGTSATPIVAMTHVRYRVTRSAAGAFVVSVKPDGGNWYDAITVTNNDYVVSTHQVVDPDAGDMISLGSGSGDGVSKVTL